MKVAVLIPGELRDIHNVKNLYEDCDVFIHSDKKYLDDAMMTSIAGIAAAMKNSG